MRRSIRFRFRNAPVEITDAATARLTLLDWLRTRRGAVGTKEGCAEGDCGACTVVLVRAIDGRSQPSPVNACILSVGQVDGAALLTIEDLAIRDHPAIEGMAPANGTLHPVQQAMIEHHGAQCGFCTPGIVMSLYALHEVDARPITRDAALDHLAGNLCRCTGYRPIVAAALAAGALAPRDGDRFAALGAAYGNDTDDVFVGDDRAFFAAPASEATLRQLIAAHPEALLVAGMTDAGLWQTKQLRTFEHIIWLGRVAGLDDIADEPGRLTLGATVSLTRAAPHLARIASDLGEVMRRFGSVQVRNSGTVGGNIANASPIGDLAPCLIALGADLELASAQGTRTLPLERYFQAYGQQDRRPGEYVRRLLVPKLEADWHFRAYKVSKRKDEDISTMLGAFAVQLEGRRIVDARIAFGGMAGIPQRARGAERELTGADLDAPSSWEAATAALDADFAPIDDARASAAYRRLVAGNLLRKALLELAGTPAATVRIAPQREAGHVG